jgi:hypothetical protein
MNIPKWFAPRGPEFVKNLATSLMSRYEITPAEAKNRTENCIAELGLNGFNPTSRVLGAFVKRYSPFFRHLHDESGLPTNLFYGFFW